MENGINAAQEAVRMFHNKHGYARDVLHNPLGTDWEWHKTGMERLHMVVSEAGELAEAWHQIDKVEIADALGDLLYVVLGSAVAAGIDLDPIFWEIHRSNMSKEPKSGRSELHPKGPDYTPPDLKPILRKQGLHV